MKKKLLNFATQGKEKITQRLADFRKNAPKDRPMIGTPNVSYEAAARNQAVAAGGIGVVNALVERVGIVDAVNNRLPIFKIRNPYFESDHVLNFAYNALAGGDALDDIELRRQDAAFLDALATPAIPDPTTAGDFCRRFDGAKIETLMDIYNDVRVKVWREQPDDFRKTALIDADGIYVPTLGEKKQGIDINYKGGWGYHPLLVSLANTGEPLFLVNRPGNVPSHTDAGYWLDKAVALCRTGGFATIRLRGDTDFALTTKFDNWDKAGVKFVFGFDAKEMLIELAEFLPEEAYAELIRELPYEVATRVRQKRENVKAQIIKKREFKNMRLKSESVTEFPYQPVACAQGYRVIVLRKNIAITKGEQTLIPEIRYFFYITNDWDKTMEEIVFEANHRCNQENLGAQLKGGVYALRAPLDTLNANWAYMVMTAFAWTLKAWLGLALPSNDKESLSAKRDIITMEFKRFVNSVILIPCQLVKSARTLKFRALAWRPGIDLLARLSVALNC